MWKRDESVKPATPPPPAPSASPAVPAAVDSPARADATVRGNGQHVMYIDDEAGLASAMKRAVELLGYRCTVYSNVEKALDAFRTNPGQFDAVISDLTMPLLSGFDVATVEPPQADHPLMQLAGLPNFILTPHVAWASREAVQTLADQLVDNVEGFWNGTPKNMVA